MPGFDGTGPRGEGPMTGGGRGNCGLPSDQLPKRGFFGRGRGRRGYGRGRGGRGRGFGWGPWRNNYRNYEDGFNAGWNDGSGGYDDGYKAGFEAARRKKEEKE